MMISEINEKIIKHNQLKALHLDVEVKSLCYNMLITLGFDEGFGQTISLYFYNISGLEINGVGGGLIQFIHPCIEKIDRGFDRINYRFSDLEHNIISFDFEDVDIL